MGRLGCSELRPYFPFLSAGLDVEATLASGWCARSPRAPERLASSSFPAAATSLRSLAVRAGSTSAWRIHALFWAERRMGRPWQVGASAGIGGPGGPASAEKKGKRSFYQAEMFDPGSWGVLRVVPDRATRPGSPPKCSTSTLWRGCRLSAPTRGSRPCTASPVRSAVGWSPLTRSGNWRHLSGSTSQTIESPARSIGRMCATVSMSWVAGDSGGAAWAVARLGGVSERTG